MDVSFVAAGWCSGSRIVVFPKQETALWQSIDNHFVCAADIDSRYGGAAALQPVDKAEVQFGGDANHYPCTRQFFIRHSMQGFSVLQKGLPDPS